MYRRREQRDTPPAATGQAPAGAEGEALDDADSDRHTEIWVPSEPDGLEVTIAADHQALSELRSRVRDFAIAQRASDELVDDLELVVSELATNVVQHTTASVSVTTVDVTDLDDDVLVSEPGPRRWTLTMTGAANLPMSSPTAPPADQHGGRGLVIVHAIVDDLSLDGDVVRCTLTD